MNARQAAWQGMNWCRPSTRLAIYLRDGLACVWCGAGVEEGARLTLDHLKPHSKGGSNAPSNLLTACKRCNDSRGARSAAKFAPDPATLKFVRATVKRALPRAEALALLKARSLSEVLSSPRPSPSGFLRNGRVYSAASQRGRS